MNTPPGTLGKYQIIREIARSNDIVYEAYDPLMNRRVALKELNIPGGTTGPQKDDRVKRFMREARAAGSLTHPNIMTVFEVGQDGDRTFIAMEYLDGHTLRNEIDTKGFLPVEDTLKIAHEVLEGLAYAHSKGVIHRDVKPDNIQLLADGRIKLTDFGIARLTFEPNLTMDGQVFGTPSYMSPEQVVGKEIDTRSDLFSMGVVLYEMLAGHKPFQGDSVVAITYAIMNREPERPSQIDNPMWHVLLKAMDKTPGLRYATAEELGEALDASQSPHADTYFPPVVVPGQSFNPYANPQAIPAPPPIANPYFNQYAAPVYPAPANANPYLTPGPVAPGYPPPVAGAGYLPPNTTSVQPGYTQAPIYYPPPPHRGPWIKPEVKFFIARLILAAVVIGLLFAMGVVLVKYFSQQVTAAKPPAATKGLDRQAEVRLAQAAEVRDNMQDPGAGQSQDAVVAAESEKVALDRWQRNDLQGAEAGLRIAVQRDPQRSSSWAYLGQLLQQQAELLPNTDDRAAMLSDAAGAYAQAYQYEQGPGARQQDALAAAQTYYDLAVVSAEAGDRQKARDALYEARKVVPVGSDLATQIEELLKQLS